MIRNSFVISMITATSLVSAVGAQTFLEVEPNSQKSEATPILGIVNGNTIGGVTTGVDITVGSTLVTTADYYRVKTAALPLGIYKHRLSQPQLPYVTTIRGLDQTGAPGIGGTAGVADVTAQTATITSPLLFNQWYGFGKEEEVYWRIFGAASTTSPYQMTFTTLAVTPTNITPTFEAGSLTISTVGLTANDTHVHLYDANLDALPGGSNDDVYPPNGVNCEITRTLTAGIYYIAMSRNNTAWNQPAPADDGYANGALMDFPNVLVRSINFPTGAQDWTFSVQAANGLHTQPNLIPPFSPYEVTWWRITVVNGAPPVVTPNDACANAIDVGLGGTKTGSFLNATNDGLSSCDTGGAFSRDVWYRITNPSASVRTLHADTCGSAADTVLSVFSACGGSELTCNDDCGTGPCGPSASCVTYPLNPGQSVRLRIGDKGIGIGALFTLHTSMLFDNDECATPTHLPSVGGYSFDTSGATTGIQGQFESLCLFAGATDIEKDLWYTFTASKNGTATISTCGLLTSATFDSKISIYDGLGCPTNSSIACWDDDGASCAQSNLETTLSWPVICGNDYTIQIGGFSPTASLVGSFNLSEVGSACATPSTAFCLGDGSGSPCPCGNNGTAGNGCASIAFPAGANLTSSGIAGASAGTDTLVLTAVNVPGPGLFFQSNGLSGSPINFGDGHLCAAVGILRMGVVFPTSGSASYPGGLTPNPIHIAGAPVSAGQTKHYQCWYRTIPAQCGPSNFNLTNGISLVWVP
ncbi:MAG: hypothetical protein SGI72_04880 [Planctomycetota bacterium]|mgnify:CR=1 FL=1|nr:hypothetical protein [Planctomycetota bacterium]